jgi:hypothetical protein
VRFRGEAGVFIIVIPHEASFTQNNENESNKADSPLSFVRRGAGVWFRGEAGVFIIVIPHEARFTQNN